MGVYKELARAVEGLNRRQKMIFPDAADFGVPCEKDTPEYRALKAIGKLAQESFKCDREVVDYETGVTVRLEFTIPWEKDGPHFKGTRYTLEYVHTRNAWKRGQKTDYCTIDVSRVVEERDPFRDDGYVGMTAEEVDGCYKDISQYM